MRAFLTTSVGDLPHARTLVLEKVGRLEEAAAPGLM